MVLHQVREACILVFCCFNSLFTGYSSVKALIFFICQMPAV